LDHASPNSSVARTGQPFLSPFCAALVGRGHIADPDCLVSADQIRHRPVGTKAETTTEGWLPRTGDLSVGLTSGASTPDNLVGAAIVKLAEFCGPPQP